MVGSWVGWVAEDAVRCISLSLCRALENSCGDCHAYVSMRTQRRSVSYAFHPSGLPIWWVGPGDAAREPPSTIFFCASVRVTQAVTGGALCVVLAMFLFYFCPRGILCRCARRVPSQNIAALGGTGLISRGERGLA